MNVFLFLGALSLCIILLCLGGILYEYRMGHTLALQGVSTKGRIIEVKFIRLYRRWFGGFVIAGKVTFHYGDGYRGKQIVSEETAKSLLAHGREVDVCFLPDKPRCARIAYALFSPLVVKQYWSGVIMGLILLLPSVVVIANIYLHY